MVDRPAARGQKRMDLSEEIAWFGNMLFFRKRVLCSRSGIQRVPPPPLRGFVRQMGQNALNQGQNRPFW